MSFTQPTAVYVLPHTSVSVAGVFHLCFAIMWIHHSHAYLSNILRSSISWIPRIISQAWCNVNTCM